MSARILELNQSLLAARANRLASRSDDAAFVAAAKSEPLLVFRLGSERFASRITDVSAVVPLNSLTPVPAADDRIRGVLSIKGEVHAVFNLARVLALPARSAGAENAHEHVMVLRVNGSNFAVAVDQVESIVATDLSQDAADVEGRRLVRLPSGERLILIENYPNLFAPFINGDAQ